MMKSLKVINSVLVDSEEKFFKDDKYHIKLIEVSKIPFVEVTSIKSGQKSLVPLSNVVYLK